MADSIVHQIEISGPQTEQTYVLPEGATTIGRQPTNNLVFVHPLVSRKHAEIVVTGNTCELKDLGSTHGTQLNHETIEAETAVILESDDVIEVGAFRMVYKKQEPSLALPEYEEPEPKTEPIEDDPQTETEETETAVLETAPLTPQESEPPTEAKPAKPKSEKPKTAKPKPKPSVSTTSSEPSQEWKTANFVPVSSGGSGNGFTHDKVTANGADEPYEPLPGQSLTYSNYLEYLPEIYRTNGESFIPRFLALLESILAPVEWTGDNFDLFLDAKTSPSSFLPWLANWYELYFDPTWSESAKRTVLQEAHLIYKRRGTSWALKRLLEIYTGTTVKIDDQNENLGDFTFYVQISASERDINRNTIEELINANKPAHTSYELLFSD